jgi:putative DNA primase/helicase
MSAWPFDDSPDHAQLDPEPRYQATAEVPLSDLGNAERLVARHGSRVRYSGATGWLIWDGTRWAPDVLREVDRMAMDVARSIRAEAGLLDDPDRAKATFNFALRSEEAPRLERMLQVAKSMPTVVVDPARLDLDPWSLNTPSGTVDLRTGQLHRHVRDNLITRITAGRYDPDVDCPAFLKFLGEIFQGNQELIDYVQLALGYSATGKVNERMMFLCFGPSASNGKSTLLETIRHVLGDYADEASSELFLSSRWGQEPAGAVAALRGRRFVSACESEEGRRLAEARIKQLTGGDSLVGRFLYRDQFSFQPTHHLWFATNHLPDITGGDQAIWDRLPVIPFNVRFEAGQRDKYLDEKLRAEADGIVSWIVRGAVAWYRLGRLDFPTSVQEAATSYRSDTDRVARWITERCNQVPGAETPAADLYADFRRWWEEGGEPGKVPSNQMFGRKLTEKGYEAGTTGHANTRIRYGLVLGRRWPA